jgi:hypothetical protein
MAFKGKYPFHSKIVLKIVCSIRISEHFNYLGCDVKSSRDNDVNREVNRLQNVCGTIPRMLE